MVEPIAPWFVALVVGFAFGILFEKGRKVMEKHAAQNKDCPLVAGTVQCLQASWEDSETGNKLNGASYNYCQSCDWWEAMCDEEE